MRAQKSKQNVRLVTHGRSTRAFEAQRYYFARIHCYIAHNGIAAAGELDAHACFARRDLHERLRVA
jgi:hypothetical protein